MGKVARALEKHGETRRDFFDNTKNDWFGGRKEGVNAGFLFNVPLMLFVLLTLVALALFTFSQDVPPDVVESSISLAASQENNAVAGMGLVSDGGGRIEVTEQGRKQSAKVADLPVPLKGLPSRDADDKTAQIKNQAFASEVRDFLEHWRRAWRQSAGQNGDLQGYFSLYSDRFAAGGKDRLSWLDDKARKNRRKEWIEVFLRDITILEKDGDMLAVRFNQEYLSSNYAETSDKMMLLVREDNGLKILSEQTVSAP